MTGKEPPVTKVDFTLFKNNFDIQICYEKKSISVNYNYI